MIKPATTQEELSIVLPALLAAIVVDSGQNPGIVDIEPISPEIAADMRALGYTELSPELMRAFAKTGQLKPLPSDHTVSVDGPLVRRFCGGS